MAADNKNPFKFVIQTREESIISFQFKYKDIEVYNLVNSDTINLNLRCVLLSIGEMEVSNLYSNNGEDKRMFFRVRGETYQVLVDNDDTPLIALYYEKVKKILKYYKFKWTEFELNLEDCSVLFYRFHRRSGATGVLVKNQVMSGNKVVPLYVFVPFSSKCIFENSFECKRRDRLVTLRHANGSTLISFMCKDEKIAKSVENTLENNREKLLEFYGLRKEKVLEF